MKNINNYILTILALSSFSFAYAMEGETQDLENLQVGISALTITPKTPQSGEQETLTLNFDLIFTTEETNEEISGGEYLTLCADEIDMVKRAKKDKKNKKDKPAKKSVHVNATMKNIKDIRSRRLPAAPTKKKSKHVKNLNQFQMGTIQE